MVSGGYRLRPDVSPPRVRVLECLSLERGSQTHE